MRRLWFSLALSTLAAAFVPVGAVDYTQELLRSYGPASNAAPPKQPPAAAVTPPSAAAAPESNSAPLPGNQQTAAVQPHPAVDAVDPATDQSAEKIPPVPLETLLSTIEAMAPEGWVASEVQVNRLPFNGSDPFTDEQTLRHLHEFRCAEIVTRSFQRGQRLTIVKIYRFQDPLGAFASYSFMRHGARTVVTRGDASSEDDDSISFWQDNCFVSIWTTSQDDDEAKGLVRTLADKLCSVITIHATPPSIVSRLPVLDRIAGSERLIMGPVLARQIFPAPFIGMLALERSKIAVVADYQYSAPFRERMKLMVIDYGSSAMALDIYDKYIDNLAAGHEMQGEGNTRVIKLSGSYLVCAVRGQRLSIISGARKRLAPMMLARQLM